MKIFNDEKLKQINCLDERFYSTDGEKFYPSVTTILEVYPKGFGFEQWLKDVGDKAKDIADRAAAFGSKVHDATERLNKGEELSWIEEGKENYTLEEWKSLLKYSDFWAKTKPELIANEQAYCSEKLGYGGTIDRVVRIIGELWLIDIKTSNYIHTSHELQLAAYAQMWNEFNPKYEIKNTGILHLKAATRTKKIDPAKNIFQGVGWQLKSFDRHYKDAFKILQHTQAIWKEENPNYKPLNMIYPSTIKL